MARDLFISYHGPDGQQALALRDLLLHSEAFCNWDIFVAESEERPLELSEDWFDEMLEEAGNSKYLIYIASDPEFLEDRKSYVYREVHTFLRAHDEGGKIGKLDCGISWFGILLDGCQMPACMKLGATYQAMYGDKQNIKLPKGQWVEDAADRILNKLKKLVEDRKDGFAADVLKQVQAFAQSRMAAFHPENLDDDLLPNLRIVGESKASQTEEEEQDGTEEPADQSGDETGKKTLVFEDLKQLVKENSVVILGNKGGCGKTTLITRLFFDYLQEQEGEPEQESEPEQEGEPEQEDAARPGGMIPLYVDAKTLKGKNYLILRNLAKNLYDDQFATDSDDPSAEVRALGCEFAEKTTEPRYLLLIDGYNEIPARVLEQFEEELQDYLPGGRYQNVRLVITGRYIDRAVLEEMGEEVKRLEINDLEKSQVIAYLREKKPNVGKIPEKLLQILMTPMYLNMYVQTTEEAQVESKGDLLTAFVDWQSEKEQNTERTRDRKALAQLLLQHFLPLFAYRMTTQSGTDSSYVFTKRALRDVMVDAQTVLGEEDYGDYYKKSYWKMFDNSGFADMNKRQLADLAEDYIVTNCTLLRENDDESFEFVHQIYRDFFCARWVSEEMKRSVEESKPSELLQKGALSADVQDFTADLLKEDVPKCEPGVWQWDYSCNDTSVVYRLLCQARSGPQGQDQVYVANLLELLKLARNKDLSGCDFSGLDLRKCDLRTCQFSRYDEKNTYPTSFAGAAIDRENLIVDGHFAIFVDACSAKGRLASLDRSGTIRVRELSDPNVTKHIITGVDPRVKKILFSKEADFLYAMTDHEILKLSIPEGEGVAEPEVFFETTKRLRSIFLNPEGELYFTTAFNAFNPKPVSNPGMPDVRDFYGLNSAAAVNTTGTQVAYGHVASYKALRIYDYDAQKDEWVEKKFGVAKLLDDYLGQMEQTLKELNLYDFFPDDYAKDRAAGNAVPERGSFFVYIQWEFSDRDHDCQDLPRLIWERVKKNFTRKRVSVYQENRLTALKQDWRKCTAPQYIAMEGGHRVQTEGVWNEERGETCFYMTVELSAEQTQRLEELKDLWTQKFLQLQQENPLIINLTGRAIESVAYKDEQTLLISCIKEYDADQLNGATEGGSDFGKNAGAGVGSDENTPNPKKQNQLRASNTVTVELNTRTMATRLLAYYPVKDLERCPMRSTYCQDGVLVFSNYLVILRDYQGKVIARLQSFDTRLQTFLELQDGGFLALARHFIYRFDLQGNCVASYNNFFEPTNCHCEVDEDGREQLVLNKEELILRDGKIPLRMDVATGCYHSYCRERSSEQKSTFKKKFTLGQKTYKYIGGHLAVFVDKRKVDGFSVPYKLLVTGCDFRNIRGSLAEETELCQLTRFGALTDAREVPVWNTEQKPVAYKPAGEPWENPKTTAQPYMLHWGYLPRLCKWKDPSFGSRRQSGTRAWIRIYEDSYSADMLDTVDMSILEWTGRLGRIDARMAYHLCCAGMLEPPANQPCTQETFGQRMENLHLRYNLLRRYRFENKEENALPHIWYTLSAEHGVKVLEKTGGVCLSPDGEWDYRNAGQKAERYRRQAEKMRKALDEGVWEEADREAEEEKYRKLLEKISTEERGREPNLEYATRRHLALNRWFSRMAAAYPGQLDRYVFFETFANSCVLDKTATVHGFTLVGDQPLFLLAVRYPFVYKRRKKTTGMLDSLCWLTKNYSHLTHNNLPETLQKPPAVVIIGEDYNHCLQLNELLREIVPEVRKLYTYDALFCGSETDVPMHFSFDDQGNTYAEDVTQLN